MIERLLQQRIRKGTLHLQLPDGRQKHFGVGSPEAYWILHSPNALRRIARDPEFELGETYIGGQWEAGPGGMGPLLEVLMRNFPQAVPGRFSRWLTAPSVLLRTLNRIGRSRRNVAHHYDLEEWLFRCFLDEDMQYSCAYYTEPNTGLDAAQRQKCDLVLRKLLLAPGQNVLDIGCGWGGLALRMAARHDVTVTGLTLSKEQLRTARQRAAERGLSQRVDFRLEDYREHRGRYDRLVSIGMFEHVGRAHFGRFFRSLLQFLAADGIALVHTIGSLFPPGGTNPWIQRYIFPGGYIPSLSEIARAVEANGLLLTDVEVLRLHYAHTLAEWQRRFQEHRAEAVSRLGERFCRIWEFYLASCEAAFRWRGLVVFQLQLARDLRTVPITRDYLLAARS